MADFLYVTLDEPVITSSGAATLQVSETLPYIPGAMLQGMVLNRAYQSGKSNQVILAEILSSNIVISDGLLIDSEGYLGLPMPMSLYVKKTAPQFDENGKLHKDIVDFSKDEWQPSYRQCSGLITGHGNEMHLRTESSMRTAIKAGTNRADEGRLYELRALTAGQSFAAYVEGKDKIEHFILNSGQLGRSKIAEFGTVQINWKTATLPAVSNANSGDRFVWCLSDFWPDSLLGLLVDNDLFSGKVDWKCSYTRKRRYSGYNAFRQARTPEREVFIRGSVFRLSNSDYPLGLQRIGLGTDQGLGLVYISKNSPLEVIRGHEFAPRIDLPQICTSSHSTELTSLARWLKATAVTFYESPTSEDVKKIYDVARHLAGGSVGPSAGHWGRIAKAAAVEDVARIEAVLRTSEGDDNPSWGAQIGAVSNAENGDPATIAAWLQSKFPVLKGNDSKQDRGKEQFRALAVLARDVRRRLQDERWLEV